MEKHAYLQFISADRQEEPGDFRVGLQKIKSRNYPYVKLNAGYGYTANWYEVGTTDLQRRLGLNYGVTVGINVFDGFNRKREQRNARIQIQNQELRTQELELGLRADMSNFWMAYRNNLDLWSLEKENLVAAQENYRIAIDRYKLGDLSGIELREAQNSLLEAEERQSIAEYSTKICEISFCSLAERSWICSMKMINFAELTIYDFRFMIEVHKS